MPTRRRSSSRLVVVAAAVLTATAAASARPTTSRTPRAATAAVTAAATSGAAAHATAAASPQAARALAWLQRSRTFESRHYQVRTDLDHATAELVASHMDLMVDAYADILGGFTARRNLRLEMWVFETVDDYNAVLERELDFDPAGSGGVCARRGTRVVLAGFRPSGGDASASLARLLSIFQHEGFHQFAHALFPSIPVWANEGLAGLFEDAVVRDGSVILGDVPASRLRFLRGALAQNGLRPLPDLLSIDPDAWWADLRQGQAGINYQQSWALVHFLLYADGGRHRDGFMRFLSLMNQGADGRAGFRQAYRLRDEAEIEPAFGRWLHDVPATDFAATLDRLAFIAAGVRTLHDEAGAAGGTAPRTLDELREALVARDFSFTVPRPYGPAAILASESSSFEVPGGGVGGGADDGPRFELVDCAGRRMPPCIQVAGLAPRAFGVRWTRRGRAIVGELVTD